VSDLDILTLTEAGLYQSALALAGGATVGGDTTLGTRITLITAMVDITITTIIMVAVADITDTELVATMPVEMHMVRE